MKKLRFISMGEGKFLHVIRFLTIQDSVHESSTVHVLLWTPDIPSILAVVQVREDGDLERPILAKCEARFVWIRV